MLSDLIYISSRAPQCTDAEIEKILASSVKNNLQLSVAKISKEGFH
jgi:hypothetical protein